MFSFSLTRWIKSLYRARKKLPFVKKPQVRPLLEELEVRLAPATFTWLGTGGNTLWSNPNNWVGNAAPTTQSAFLANLVFPGSVGAQFRDTVDDIKGLDVNSIEIGGSNYLLAPNPVASGNQSITLGNPTVTGSGTLTDDTGALNDYISLNIQLAGASGSQQFFTVQQGAQLYLTGQISGIATSNITKEGLGTLDVTGNNSTFSGLFTVDQNAGIVAVNQANALGNINSSATQTLAITGGVAGTTNMVFTFGAGTPAQSMTAAIPYTGTSADSAALQAALDVLPNITIGGGAQAGAVFVSQTNVGSTETFTITFAGGYTGAVGPATGVTGSATGGGSFAAPTLTSGGLATGNSVVVGLNSQLQLDASIGTVPTFGAVSPFTITFSGPAPSPAGFTVVKPLILNGPGIHNDGALLNQNGTNTWQGSVTLDSNATIGAAPTSFIVGGAVTTLNITGVVGDNGAGFNVTKEGAGVVYLDPVVPLASPQNPGQGNTYRGSTIVNGGTLQIGQPFALGPGGEPTIVDSSLLESGTLALNFDPLSNTPGHPQIPTQYLVSQPTQTITFTNPVPKGTQFTLSFGGATTLPITFQGNATDVANIQNELDSLATIGVIGGTATVTPAPGNSNIFTITLGGNLVGENPPLITATITSAPPFGAPNPTVAVTATTGGPAGFIVPSELLTINGPGQAGTSVAITNGNKTAAADTDTLEGALANENGQNSWQQPINLWSSSSAVLADAGYYAPVVGISADAGTSLTINGVIQDAGIGSKRPGNPYSFAKIGMGRLILTASNTFVGHVDILQGSLNVRDSQALGQTTSANLTTVWDGASLELQTDSIPDSITSTFNPVTNALISPDYNLLVPLISSIQIDGLGVDGEGALRNVSGVNKIEGSVVLGSNSSIDVEPDPDPENLQGATWNDLSQLTIDGVVSSAGVGGVTALTTLTKVGFGELVLSAKNTYQGPATGVTNSQTFVEQGWITVENNQALGQVLSNAVQTLTLTNVFRDGMEFSLTFEGATTSIFNPLFLSGNIAFDTADIRAALDALPTIANVGGSVQVVASSDSFYTITFQQGLAAQNEPLITATFLTLQPGPPFPPASVSTAIVNSGGLLAPDSSVTVAAGAALVLKRNLSGNDLNFAYDMYLSGTGMALPSPLSMLEPWLNQKGALENLDGNNVSTGQVFLNGITVTFQNSLADTPFLPMTVANNSLTGAGASVSVATAVVGGPGVNEVQDITFNGTITGGTFELSFVSIPGGAPQTTGPIAWNANELILASNIQAALNALGNIGTTPSTWNVAVGGVGITFQGSLANTPTALMSVNPGGLIGAFPTAAVGSAIAGGPGVDSTQVVLFGGQITGGTFTLSFDGLTTQPIAFSAITSELDANIQSALNQLVSIGDGNTFVGPYGGNNTVGIGAELDGANDPNPPVSQLTLTGEIGEIGSASGVEKLGSQRVIIEDNAVNTGETIVAQGVLRIQNDTALGSGFGGTVVDSGAALELAPVNEDFDGGVPRGIQVWGNHLTLNGAGDPEFSDSPLEILADDNVWRGPITLNSSIAVTFEAGATIGGTNVPTMTAFSNLQGFNPSVSVATTIAGGDGANTVQTISFGGVITTGTFRLSVTNGAGTVTATTGNITWSNNTNTLIANIQAALNALATNFGASTPGFVLVALLSPAIGAVPNSRITLAGSIDDGTGSNIADLTIGGGGEVVLAGANTYRGTTYVNQGIVTVSNGQALGQTGVAGVQALQLTGAAPGATKFTLTFNGATTTPIAYTGTDADIGSIQSALDALSTVGPSASVTVVDGNAGVFLLTFGGSLAAPATQNLMSVAVTAGPGSGVVGTEGGTIVAQNAQLQMESGVTVAGEPLLLQGTGNNNVVQQSLTLTDATAGSTAFTLSFNGQSTPSAPPLVYTGVPATDSINIQNALNALTTIATPGGSVTVTPGPATPEVQSLTLTGFNNLDQFTLTFGANTTAPITYLTDSGNGVLEAAAIQSALNPSVLGAGNSATVTWTGATGIFTVAFGGGLAGANPAALTGTAVAPSGGTVSAAIDSPGAVSFIITFGGAFAGQNQSPVLGAIFAGAGSISTATVQSAFGAASEVQSFTVIGSGLFTLTFEGETTPLLQTPASAVEVENALNGLPAIESTGGFVSVSETINGTTETYVVTFGGTMAAKYEPQIVGSTSIPPMLSTGILQQGASFELFFGGPEEIQTITVSGSGAFTLTFVNQSFPATLPDTTGPISTSVTAPELQSILDSLTSIVEGVPNTFFPPPPNVSGSVSVTEMTTPTANVFSVTFTGGYLSASYTGEPLITATAIAPPTVNALPMPVTGGTGNTASTPLQFFAVGPAPVTNGQGLGNLPVTGPVSDVAVDPKNPDNIYVSTFGGGAWKSTDGGISWEPMFDSQVSQFAGAIAVAPESPNILYLGTGVATDQSNNVSETSATGLLQEPTQDLNGYAYYGTGVYESQDYGVTWTLLTDTNLTPIAGEQSNPIAGMGVSSIIVDPNNPALIYVATSNVNIRNAPPPTTGSPEIPGVFSWNAIGSNEWFDLTSYVSPARSLLFGQLGTPPKTPGPDDDFRIEFPSTLDPLNYPTGFAASWSSLSLVYADPTNLGGVAQPILYAALGTPDGDMNNAVFRAYNPNTDGPTWYIGDPGPLVNQVEMITIDYPNNTGTFTLSFEGKTTPVMAVPGGVPPPTWPGSVVSAMQALLPPGGTITVVPGSVNVVAGQTTFNVVFGGVLADSPEPLFTSTFAGFGPLAPNPPVFSSIVTPGSGIDTRSTNEFPTGNDGHYGNGSELAPPIILLPLNGNIKITAVATGANLKNVVLYAVVSSPVNWAWSFLGGGTIDRDGFGDAGLPTGAAPSDDVYNAPEDINGNEDATYVSDDGGVDWSTTPSQPPADFEGTFQGLVNNTQTDGAGNYALAIAVNPANSMDVIVASVGDGLPPAQLSASGPYYTMDGGTTWFKVGLPATPGDLNGNAPQVDFHAITFEPDGNVLFATDGGLWQLNNPFTVNQYWTDLNGNIQGSELNIAQINQVSQDPDNVNAILAAAQQGGALLYSGSPAWTLTNAGIPGTGTGSQIVYDPDNSQIAYSVQGPINGPNTTVTPLPQDQQYNLFESTDGGATWNPNPLPNTTNPFPMVLTVDPNNDQRLVLTGTTLGFNAAVGIFTPDLEESENAGQTWTNITPKGVGAFAGAFTAVALARYQGTFQQDPGFPSVTDQGVNAPDQNTIYVTDGTNVYLTKDGGVNWVKRDGTGVNLLPAGNPQSSTISDIVVDPTDRDTVYAIVNGNGNGEIFRSTDAGRNWFNISLGLPNGVTGVGIPADSLAIDSRTGNLYLGTDDGIYILTDVPPTGTLNMSASFEWQRFSLGLPGTQITQIVLSQNLNTLTVATYGHGVYQFYLDDQQANSGAMRAESGADQWTGPIYLAGPTTIEVDGTQALQTTTPAAQLNVFGTISDQTPGADSQLTKAGQGDLILSGANTYGGTTVVQAGNLIGHNQQALASTGTAEVQTLNVGTAGGTFQLGFNGSALTGTFTAGTSTGAQIQSALNALATIGGAGGAVSVTPTGVAGTYTITFPPGENFFGFAEPLLTVANGSGSASMYTLTQTLTIGNTGTFTLSFNGSAATAPLNPLTTSASQIATALDGLSTIGPSGSVIVTATATPGVYTVAFGGSLAGTPQPLLSIVNSGGATASVVGNLTGGVGSTIVDNGAALELETSLNAEPIELFGNGFLFDGHFQGALVNLSNNNTYNGTLVLESNATIGVDSGSSLSIVSPGTITDEGNGFELSKESPGTLILTTADTYGEGAAIGTNIIEGAVDVENADALGNYATIPTTTSVTDGAALDVQEPATASVPLVISNETLFLSGTGDGQTGALDDVSKLIAGNNALNNITWTGPITFTDTPGFDPSTSPVGVVALGVDNAGVSLTLPGSIGEVLPTGLSKAGNGELVLAGTNDYSGTTYITSGNVDIQNADALGTNNTNEVQRVTVYDPGFTGVPGPNDKFTLTFNGQTTGLLNFGVNPTGGVTPTSSVANALNALTTIGGLPIPGSVTVFENVVTNGAGQIADVYTIIFGGSLAGQAQSPLLANPSGVMTINISRVANGDIGTLVGAGAALQVDGDLQHNGSSIAVLGENLALNGAGLTATNAGAIENVSGNNTWTGSVILQSNTSIGAHATTNLTVSGIIQDPSPNPVDPANLTTVGTGTVTLTSANTYTGDTTVVAGDLNIQNAQSLGINTSSIQQLTVSGTTGTFTLSYNDGVHIGNTGALAPTIPASTLQTDLDNLLATIGLGTASVTVTVSSSNVFDILFGGTLANVPVPTLGSIVTGFLNVGVQPLLAGAASSTTVDSGATLQLQNIAGGPIVDADKPIVVNGGGFNNAGAIENVSGSNTWSAPFALGANASLGADSASTLTITQPISDSAQTQTLSFSTFTPGEIYSLNLGGFNTGSLTFSGVAAVNVNTIQAALNSLPSITEYPGLSVTVTANAGNTVFTVGFVGAPPGTILPPITGNSIGQASLQTSSKFNVTKVGTGTVDYANIGNEAYTGTTNVMNGLLALDSSGTAIFNTLTVGDATPVNQVQTLTLNGYNSGTDQFELKFGANTTGAITYYGNATFEAAAIQAALNLPAILGAGNTATVSATATPGVFTVAFGGGLAGTNPAPLTFTNLGAATGTIGIGVTTTGGVPTPSSAIAQLEANSEIANTKAVTVNSDGKFDLNNFTQQIGALTINGGLATTGAGASGGTLTASSITMTDGEILTPGSGSQVTDQGLLTMTGGIVDLANANSNLTLGGNVNATADANGPATIEGAGNLVLGGTTRNFSVSAFQPNDVDMLISANIVSTSGEGINKNLAGRLEITASNPLYTGTTTINAGDLEVNGVIGTVVLDGGSLSGTGTVGTVSGAPAPNTVSPGGTVDPGDNNLTDPTGTLTTGAADLGSANTIFVDLNPTGGDLDVLDVDGNLTFEGALLTGSIINNTPIAIGTIYTIINSTSTINPVVGTGTVPPNALYGIIGSGPATAIAQDGTVFIGGQKFTVHYFTNSVQLTKALETATVAVAAAQDSNQSANAGTSVYGQDVTFTATVTPEPGATVPTGDTVTFTLDQGTANQVTVTEPVNAATGKAIWDPQMETPGAQAVPPFTWSLGTHTINATFNDTTGLFSPATQATAFTQTVNQGTTTVSMSSNPSVTAVSPVYGQSITVTATIRPVVTPTTAGAANPTGTVTFTIDPGTSTLELVNFNPGDQFTLSFNGGATNTAAITYSANPATTAAAISAALPGILPGGSTASVAATSTAGEFVVTYGGSLSGQSPNLGGAAVSPSFGNITLISTFTGVNLNNADQATLVLPLLAAGTHTIQANYVGDSNYIASVSTPNFSLPILKDSSVVAVSAFPASSTLGQTVTLVAQVTPHVISSPGSPTGTVQFYDGTIASGNFLGTGIINGTSATITTTMLSVASHTIIADYLGDGNYTGTTGQLSPYVVAKAPTATAFLSPPSTSSFGATVDFTVSVAANPSIPQAQFGSPTGTVSFYNNTQTPSNLLFTVALTNSGAPNFNTTASIADSALSAGTHTILAVYSGDPKFASGPAAQAVIIVGPASTTVSVSAFPASNDIFGQTITLTAGVTSTGGTPTIGSVTFVDSNTGVTLGTGNVNGAGLATITTNVLTAATHTINANYNDTVNTNYASGSGQLNNYTVAPVATKTGLTISPVSGDLFGQSIGLTATVTWGTAQPVTAGAVTFVDTTTGTVLGTTSVNVNGVATLFSTVLTAGTHAIAANYQDVAPDTDFGASTGTANNYGVAKANTSVTMSASPSSGDVYGSFVTLTATITSATAGMPSTGTVTFVDSTTGATLGTGPILAGGIATLVTTALPQGTQSITANYVDAVSDNNFANGSGPIGGFNYSVAAVGTVSAVTASPASGDVYGQMVTLTAAVASTGGTPTTGTFTFVDTNTTTSTNTTLGTVSVNAFGQATLTTSLLAAADIGNGHTITATYNDTAPNTNFSSSAGTLTDYYVAPVPTNVAVSVTPATGDALGNNVTLTANVTSAAGGPSVGSVTFTDLNTSTNATATLGTANVSITSEVQTLTVGSAGTFQLGFNSPALTASFNPLTVTGNQISTALDNLATIGGVGGSVIVTPNTTSATFSITFVSAFAGQNEPVLIVQESGGATASAAITADASGQATLVTNVLTAGIHTITGTYNDTAPNVNFAQGSGQLTGYVVAGVGTTTSLAATPSVGDTYGKLITLVGTVTTTSGAATSGSVTFVDTTTGTTLGTVGVNASGKATLTTSVLTGGTHTLTANFSDTTDLSFASSTGTINGYVVGQAATTEAVTESPASGVDAVGVPATFTATVTLTASPGVTPTTGTVTFMDTSTSTVLGTGTVNGSGVASIVVNSFVAGVHSITATYNDVLPDTNFASSTVPVSYDVAGAMTTTTIGALPSSGDNFGQTVIFSATVSSTAGTPTIGSVTFTDTTTGMVLGTMSVNSAGQASISTSALTGGTHTITATYNDVANNNFGSSTGTLTNYTVIGGALTATAVSANPPSGDLYGETITLTATVTSPAGGTPTVGVVTFKDSTTGTTLGTAGVNGSGVATLPTSALTQATHTITATYNDTTDNNFLSSSGQLTSYAVATSSTTTTLSANPGSGDFYGEPVTLTAAITAASGATPTFGSVTFVDTTTGVTLGIQGVNASGVATLVTSALTATTHTITATYSDAANTDYASSNMALTGYQVAPAGTSLALVSSSINDTSGVGAAVTFTATVTAQSPSAVNVTAGTVTFVDTTTGVTLGTVTVNGSGVATVSSNSLAQGANTIVATYSNGTNANFVGGASNSLTQTVLKVANVSVTANPPTTTTTSFGTSIALSVTVSGTGGTPTGNVTVTEGTTFLGGGTLVGGSVSGINIMPLHAGSNPIVVTYGGDSSFAPNQQTLTFTVKAATTTTSLSSSPNSSEVGQTVTLTAVVTAATGGPPTAGTVTFKNGTTTIGTSSTIASSSGNSSTFTFTTVFSSVSASGFPLTASFGGSTDGDFGASGSGTDSQVVKSGPTLSALSPTTWTQGSFYSANITVTGGSGTYTSLTPSGVPAGLSASLTGSTITLSGIPSSSGTFTGVTFTVQDSNGVNGSQTDSMTINATPTLGALSNGNAAYNTSYNGSIAIAGGTTAFKNLSVTGLPTGLHAALSGRTISITGVPTVPGTYSSINVSVSDATGAVASGTFSITVNLAATTTSLTAPATWAINQVITFTATVTSPAGTPAVGTVTFTIDGNTVPVTTSGGVAKTTFKFTTTGSHSVSASYGGATNFQASTSKTITQLVRKPDTVTIAATPANPSPGTSITFTATVTGSGGVPTGTVNFYNGTTLLGTGTVNASGVATFVTASLPAATYTITATYEGDNNFLPETTSKGVSVSVKKGRIT